MPKRKRDNDIEKLSRKFRKLEKQLKQAQQQRRRSPTSHSSRENSVLSAHSYEAAENSMDIFSDDVAEHRLASAVRIASPTVEVQVHSPVAALSPAPSQPGTLDPAQAPRAPSPPALQPRSPSPQPPPPPPLQAADLCPIAEPCTSAATACDPSFDDDLIDILGDDPSETTQYGKDIHLGLSSRLDYLIVNGLDIDARKELNKKHLPPANCLRMIPPILNPEIKAALPEASLKRDKGIENRQKQVGTALACLSDVISSKMQEKDKDQALLKQLMDAAKLMCDTIHADSLKRRYFALSSLKKDINDHLMQTKIDKYLFGESLAETLKTAKAVTKSGTDIKVAYDRNIKRVNQQQQPSTSRGLNWKAPPSTRRQSGPQRSRQPIPPAGARAQPPPPPPPNRPPPPPHASWSRTSRNQPRNTRRQ